MKMKKIAFYCVNYNSNETLCRFLESIDVACERTKKTAMIDVFVSDNSETVFPVDYLPRLFTVKHIVCDGNRGYLGGIEYAMNIVSPSSYDYAILCNIDILLSSETLTSLVHYDAAENVGWIAPSIYENFRGINTNPFAVDRYSVTKLRLLRLSFKYPIIHYVYSRTLQRMKKYPDSVETRPIYAGHGSFMILTKEFFKRCSRLDYPVFLYGEELYLAEECRRRNLKVVYVPDIKLTTLGSVSTRKLKRNSLYRYNYEALTFIIDQYYR